MRSITILLAASATLLAACDNRMLPTQPPLKPSLGYGGNGILATFIIRGVSWGADGGEFTNNNCSPTYTFSRDSTMTQFPGNNWWIYSSKYDRTGCAIGTGGGGDFYVGGNVSVYSRLGQIGVGVVADQQSEAQLAYSPYLAADTIEVSASGWSWAGNSKFYYWEVTRDNGSQYRVCTPYFERPGNTDDVRYVAYFKQCVENAQGICENSPGIGTNSPCNTP